MSLREQMHKHSNGDYFNVKDVRGSSPAASLAADLSQNFRLDSESRFVLMPGTWFESVLVNMLPVPSSPLLEEHSSLLA
jgi:M-phase inducer tyrosine phosphatase